MKLRLKRLLIALVGAVGASTALGQVPTAAPPQDAATQTEPSWGPGLDARPSPSTDEELAAPDGATPEDADSDAETGVIILIPMPPGALPPGAMPPGIMVPRTPGAMPPARSEPEAVPIKPIEFLRA